MKLLRYSYSMVVPSERSCFRPMTKPGVPKAFIDARWRSNFGDRGIRRPAKRREQESRKMARTRIRR